MKRIIYHVIGYNSVFNPKTEEVEQVEVPASVNIPWNEANEEIAKAEAYKGEYTIEDDGQPEPETEVSTDDVLNAMLGVM